MSRGFRELAGYCLHSAVAEDAALLTLKQSLSVWVATTGRRESLKEPAGRSLTGQDGRPQDAVWNPVVVMCLSLVQGLMFQPVGGETCSDNIDCVKGCCLMTGYRHRRPSGCVRPWHKWRSVMEDPRCIPTNVHPYILAMKGFRHSYNRHNIHSVPAE
ncbi:hypothetical protein GWK47_028976 [Chionoecetes opilio]|uniref:Uncharacterized protein n=1 Tax=Chionoecetes opilio TaxID=41210 RepID=A0A8J4YN64_CHIOP|nr:hypothetical protein GWK47_028976 [Chionoecetes opilio]